MNEQKLIEKLRLIEALFSGAATKGEEVAAGLARERILERLRRLEKADPLIEYRFTMSDMWSRKVFVALLRRYDIKPYRYHRQRYTTVMAQVSKRFVDETLWPEFMEISETLQAYLSDITDRVVSQVIHQDSSEAEVVKEQPMITSGREDVEIAAEPEFLSADQANQTADSTGNGTENPQNSGKKKKKKTKRGKKRR